MIYTKYLENTALLAPAELILGEKPDAVEGGGPEAGHRRLLHLTVQRLLLPTSFPALCNIEHRLLATLRLAPRPSLTLSFLSLPASHLFQGLG
jgi:hypothetical protein